MKHSDRKESAGGRRIQVGWDRGMWVGAGKEVHPKQSIYENTTKNFITLYAVLIKYPGENNVRERGSIFSYSSKL